MKYAIPDWMFEQFQPRRNHNINMQELVCTPVLLGTFGHVIQNCLVTYLGDAQGINVGFLKGSGSQFAADINVVIGRSWLQLCQLGVGFHVNQVESAANLADEPSRLRRKVPDRLGAVWTAPLLPTWILDIWKHPGLDDTMVPEFKARITSVCKKHTLEVF